MKGLQNFIVIILIFAVIAGCQFFSSNKNENQINTDEALLKLGRYLFYDRNLSVNNTKACASCHAQEFSFTDSYTKSIGALGDLHQRNAKPLINLKYNKYFTAADSSIKTLEQQMNNPMFNQHPIEMGMKGNEEIILNRIKEKYAYKNLFVQSFPNQSNPFTIANIQTAIAVFEKTLTTFNAPYDKFLAGNYEALTSEQRKGLKLFFSKKLNCSRCHSGTTFSIPEIKSKDGIINYYQNIGLYQIYPKQDEGLYSTTKNEKDKGKFKVPTLRNLAFTAPYFHDGSAITLEDVITVYEKGGRNITLGINNGDGRKNTNKSNLITGFQLTLQERTSLINFLYALSDSSVLTNKAFANPFNEDETN